jgi:hypothetical protein
VSAVQLRKTRTDEQTELLREIRDLLRDMLADQRRHSPAAVPALLVALEEHFGPGRFTVRTVLEVVEENPHGALAEAVAHAVDMNLSPRSRATALGALLARLPEVEVIAERPGIYRLRR